MNIRKITLVAYVHADDAEELVGELLDAFSGMDTPAYREAIREDPVRIVDLPAGAEAFLRSIVSE